MQPDSSQNPNPNPNPNSNHQHDQYHRHFHHHCTHHPPFPHVHIPVFFCPHHHLHLHLHHLHLHANQIPCNFSLPSSSSSLSPLPLSRTLINQTSQGPEIHHAAVSDLELPPQELAASNILEDNEEEEEDVYVLTDEWAEFFAKSEAKRQLDIKQNRLKQNLKRQGSLAGGVHGGPVPTSSLLNSVRYKATELFVGGLSHGTDDQSLKEAFSNFGNVTEARVITDRDTGRSKGFGFISFDTAEAAKSALSSIDGQKLHGRKMRVSYANGRPASGFRADRGLGGSAAGSSGSSGGYGDSTDMKQNRLKQNLKRQGSLAGGVHGGPVPTSSLLNSDQYTTTKLFVCHRAQTIKSLKEAFSTFGNVTEARVLTHNRGRSRGFGFISFDTDEAAQSALSSMDGQKLHGRNIQVSYAKGRSARGFCADRGYGGSAGGHGGSSGSDGGSSDGDGGSSGGYGGSAGQNDF